MSMTAEVDAPTTWEEAARQALTSLTEPEGVVCGDATARWVIVTEIDAIRAAVRGRAVDSVMGRKLRAVGVAAIDMLRNKGMWDEGEMLRLLCRKQHDYGHGNILAFGMVGVAVRCSDKVARFINLTDKGEAGAAEPLEDALVDMVGYAIIATMLMRGTFTLELSEGVCLS